MKFRNSHEGSIIGSILRMGLPSMIGFAAVNIYDLIDMFWVARLGPENVAAITIFFSFSWVIGSVNQIAGTGSLAVISRRYGERDLDATEAAIKEAILLKWLLAIFFGSIGYMLVGEVLVILGASGRVLELGISYGHIHFLGLGLFFSSYTIYTGLRGIGDPNKAMIIMISGVVLNMVLDPFLIFGWWIFPELGLVGAAVASVFTYGFTFTVGLIIFFSGTTSIKMRFRSKHPISIVRLWRMMKIGAPAGITSTSFALSRMVVMPMVAVFGTNVVAAYGMGMRVSALGVMMVVGMGLGVSALIGNILGARKIERARQTAETAILFAASVMGFFGLVNLIGAPIIVRFFFDSPVLIYLGVELLRINALISPSIGVNITMEMIHAGAGDNRPPMFFSMLYSWGLQIPLILLTTRIFGFDQNGVWWSMAASNFITTVCFYIYYRRGRWLQRRV